MGRKPKVKHQDNNQDNISHSHVINKMENFKSNAKKQKRSQINNDNKNAVKVLNEKKSNYKKQKNMLRQLESNFSPNYIALTPTKEGKCSRYGRQQKYKEIEGFLPTDVLYSVKKTKINKKEPRTPEQINPDLKLITNTSNIVIYISPIDKLINKNKQLAALCLKSPNQNWSPVIKIFDLGAETSSTSASVSISPKSNSPIFSTPSPTLSVQPPSPNPPSSELLTPPLSESPTPSLSESPTPPSLESTTPSSESDSLTPPAKSITPPTESFTPPSSESPTPPLSESHTPPLSESHTPPSLESTAPPSESESHTPPSSESSISPLSESPTPPLESELHTPPSIESPKPHSSDSPTVPAKSITPPTESFTPPSSESSTPPSESESHTPPSSESSTPPLSESLTPPLSESPTPPLESELHTRPSIESSKPQSSDSPTVPAKSITPPTESFTPPSTDLSTPPLSESHTPPSLESTTPLSESESHTPPSSESSIPPLSESPTPPLESELHTRPSIESSKPQSSGSPTVPAKSITPPTESFTPPSTDLSTPPLSESHTPPSLESTAPPLSESLTPPLESELHTPPSIESPEPPLSDSPTVPAESTTPPTESHTPTSSSSKSTIPPSSKSITPLSSELRTLLSLPPINYRQQSISQLSDEVLNTDGKIVSLEMEPIYTLQAESINVEPTNEDLFEDDSAKDSSINDIEINAEFSFGKLQLSSDSTIAPSSSESTTPPSSESITVPLAESTKAPSESLIPSSESNTPPIVPPLNLRQMSISQWSDGALKTDGKIVSLEMEPIYTLQAGFIKIEPKTEDLFENDSAKGSSINDIEINTEWFIGKIAWGRLGSYPYWPCMVCNDTNGNRLMKTNYCTKIYIRFFGDSGRSSWIPENCLIDYNGIKGFTKLQQSVSTFKKSNRRYKMFHVKHSQQLQWLQAVFEADKAIQLLPPIKRIQFFDDILLEKFKKSNHRLSLSKDSMLNDTDRNSSFSPNEINGISLGLDSNQRINKNNSIHKFLLSLSESERPIEYCDNITENTSDVSVKIEQDEEEISDCDSSILLNKYKKQYLLQQQKTHFKNKLINNNTVVVKDENLLNSKVKSVLKSTRQTKRQEALNKNKINSIELSSEKVIKITKTNKIIKDENRIKKKEVVHEEFATYITKQYPKNYLFKGLSKESVCGICFKPNNIFKCNGLCGGYFHIKCGMNISEKWMIINSNINSYKNDNSVIKINDVIIKVNDSIDKNLSISPSKQLKISKNFMCDNCSKNIRPTCFACNKKDNECADLLIKCSNKMCHYYFHKSCLKYWPQSQITESSSNTISIHCPCHTCHTCISDNPRGKYYQLDITQLSKCILCPATYHRNSFCIPAGSNLLSTSQMICPRHKVAERPQANANWCFICTGGGTLICCDSCPTSFHLDCLKLPCTPDSYICEECETGRLPLYGEIVWAKVGQFRWWPSIIMPPMVIPQQVMASKHKPNDFCVRFFGTNDFFWIGCSFVFLYQEGDWGPSNQSTTLGNSFSIALKKAKEMYKQIQETKFKFDDFEKDKFLKPMPYIKIKTNRAVPPVKLNEGHEQTSCECKITDDEPCGPNSGCLNRCLVTECHPKICPAGNKCLNRMFETRLYPKTEVKLIDGKGFGLVSLENIVAGTFVIEYVGEVINNEEFQRRLQHKQIVKDEHYYFFTLTKDTIIDAGPKGNVARFINHSCEPNCVIQKWRVNGCNRLGFFAIIDIPKGTEITFDYNLECIGEEKKVCHCRAAKCSGFIGDKYKEKTVEKGMKKARGRQKLHDKNIKIKINRKLSEKKISKGETIIATINPANVFQTNGDIFYDTTQNIKMGIKEKRGDILSNGKIDETPNLENYGSLNSNRNLLNNSLDANIKQLNNEIKTNESNNKFSENNKSIDEITVLSVNKAIEITKNKMPANLTNDKYISDKKKKAKQPNNNAKRIPIIYNNNLNENLVNDNIKKRNKMVNMTRKRKLILVENTKIQDEDVTVATTNTLKRRKIRK